MNIDNNKLFVTVGVTGHSDIIASEESSIVTRFVRLVDKLREDYPNLNIRILTGLAEGADQLIAKLAIRLSNAGCPIQPVAILPMPLAEYRSDFSADKLKDFDALVQVMVDNDCPIVELSFEQERNHCYVNLGRYLINKSDILVSIWNGVLNADEGGTSYVTQACLDPLRRIVDARGNVQGVGNEFRLNNYLYDSSSICVYKIDANRDSMPLNKIDSLHCGYIDSVTGDLNNLEPDLPKTSNDYFEYLNGLSKSLEDISESELSKVYPLVPEVDQELYFSETRDLVNIFSSFRCFDALANKLQSKTKSLSRMATLLTLVLTVVFLAYENTIQHPFVLISYVLLFGGSYICDGSLAKKIQGKGIVEAGVISSVLRQMSFLGRKKGSDIEVNEVLKNWIENQSFFYKGRIEYLKKIKWSLDIGEKICVAIPVVIIVSYLTSIYVGFHFIDSDWDSRLVFYASGIFPVIAITMKLYAQSESIDEIFFQYSATNDYLIRLINLINNTDDKDMVTLGFEVAGVELSSEHTVWVETVRSKQIGMPEG